MSQIYKDRLLMYDRNSTSESPAPVFTQHTFAPVACLKIFPSASSMISINGLPNLVTASMRPKRC